MDPVISIVIPVYNVEKYLRDCIDSVLSQTMLDFELICIDDGSTDSSAKILDEYALADSRVKVVHQTHTNAGHCRNVGLDMAKGEYLLFLDSDDVFSPSLLSLMHKEMTGANADIVTCCELDYVDGCPLPTLDAEHSRIRRFQYDCVASDVDVFSKWSGRAWDKLFRASFVKRLNIRFQEQRSSNDLYFTFSALAEAKNVVKISAQLIAHRINPNSLESTRSKGVGCIFSAFDAVSKRILLRSKFCNSDYVYRRFRCFVARILMWYWDTIDTDEAYIEVYRLIGEEAVGNYKLDQLTAVDFAGDEVTYERLGIVLSRCSLITALRAQVKLQRRQLELLPGKYIDPNSWEGKIGRIAMWWPRKVKSIIKKI